MKKLFIFLITALFGLNIKGVSIDDNITDKVDIVGTENTVNSNYKNIDCNINEDNSASINSLNLNDNKANEDIVKNVYGCWLLEEVAYWDIVNATSLNRPVVDESQYIGSIFEYQKDYIKINGRRYENIIYNTTEIDLNISYTRSIQNFSDYLEKYNYNNKKMNRVDVSADYFNGFGDSIDIIDENHIVINGYAISIMARKINPQNLNKADISKPPNAPNPTYLYGKWKIIDKYVANNSEANAGIETNIGSEYLGQVYEYQKDYCVFNGKKYYKPTYAYDVELGSTSMSEMMSFESFRPIILKYNLEDKGNNFSYIQQSVIFEYEADENIGLTPCYVNENYIVFILWYYENDNHIFLVAEKI